MGVRSSFFDEPCWKKTIVSFRVLSSFETTILLRSSSSESSLSRLSRPRHGKYRSKIMFSVSKCRYVFRLNEKKEEAKKEKEKSHHFQFRVSEKEEHSSCVSPL